MPHFPWLILFSSIPAFLAAIALIYVFSYKLDLFPLMGAYDTTFVAHVTPISANASIPDYTHWPTLRANPEAFFPTPSVVNPGAVGGMGAWDAGDDDHDSQRGLYELCGSKGLNRPASLLHTLRNALLPMSTNLGLSLSPRPDRGNSR